MSKIKYVGMVFLTIVIVYGFMSQYRIYFFLALAVFGGITWIRWLRHKAEELDGN